MNQWDQCVKEGRRLVGELTLNKFALGDETLKPAVAPMGKDGAHNETTEKLQAYANAIGIPFQTLRSYRGVAAAWPPDERSSGAAWSVHKELAGDPDRFKTLAALAKKSKDGKVTLNQLAAHKGQRPHSGARPPASVPDKARAVKDYLSDPAVATAAMADDETRVAVSRAKATLDAQRSERVRKRESAESPGLVSMAGFWDALADIDAATRRANEALAALRSVPEVTDEMKTALQLHVGYLRTSVDWLESFTESGDLSFEDELEQLLGQGK